MGAPLMFDSNLSVADDNSVYAVRATERKTANEVVARHSELVSRIAHHLITRLPASVDVDDLMQSGMIGLIEASRSFNASQGASFETYASIRIRGAMLDELRKGDWVPRSVHRHLRAATETTRAVEQKTGRAATSREVAAAMGMPIGDYGRLLADAVRSRVLSLEAHADNEDTAPLKFADHAASPAQRLDDDEFRRELVNAIESLPERERLVLSLYYEQELNLREVGAVLEVSDSRACQIHAQALMRVRARLQG
jgi:RNA polymerase sigma factor for flagellar operon FliA